MKPQSCQVAQDDNDCVEQCIDDLAQSKLWAKCKRNETATEQVTH